MKRFLAAIVLGCLPAPALAYTPNDPHLSLQTYVPIVQAEQAWDYARGSNTVIVADLDSGMDLSHPDLKENIWTNLNEIPGDGIDNDNDGYIDDVHGWDFVKGTNNVEPDLSQGWLPAGADHGTIISGLIAATGDNREGIAGLAFGVKIMPLKIVDVFGTGDSSHVAPAIRYAVDHGASVINMSFTGPDIDPTLEEEIYRAYEKGVVVVAAVGNTHAGGMDLAQDPLYPACFQRNGIRPLIGVAATDLKDARASFSNFGIGCVDISAPGTDIYSTSLYRPQFGDFTQPYQDSWNGTSFASPLVAGAAALLLSVHPLLTPDQVRSILQLSADPIVDTVGAPLGSMGSGRLNMNKALQIAGSFDGTGPAVLFAHVSVSPLTPSPPGGGFSPNSVGGDVAQSATVGAGAVVSYDRVAVNATLPPTAPVDSLVRTASLPAVYVVGLDGKRHPFPNDTIYRSWFADFSGVKVISDADMASIPLGMPVLVRPGTYWVKIQSDPKTYYVAPDGYTLQWVKDEPTALVLGGADWAKRVIDIEPTYFTKFRAGPDIDQISLSSAWPSGALVQAPGNATVWYVEAGTRRRVDDFVPNRFQATFVRTLLGAWQMLPEGMPIAAVSDDLFSRQFLVTSH